MDEGFINAIPELAVEVISPNDNAMDVEDKVQTYLKSGCSKSG